MNSAGARTACSNAGTRKDYLAELAAIPLLIVDDLGMRKLAHTAAEDLLELIMRRYERASTLLTSNRPVDDWGKLLGDTAAVTALLDVVNDSGLNEPGQWQYRAADREVLNAVDRQLVLRQKRSSTAFTLRTS